MRYKLIVLIGLFVVGYIGGNAANSGLGFVSQVVAEAPVDADPSMAAGISVMPLTSVLGIRSDGERVMLASMLPVEGRLTMILISIAECGFEQGQSRLAETLNAGDRRISQTVLVIPAAAMDRDASDRSDLIHLVALEAPDSVIPHVPGPAAYLIGESGEILFSASGARAVNQVAEFLSTLPMPAGEDFVPSQVGRAA